MVGPVGVRNLTTQDTALDRAPAPGRDNGAGSRKGRVLMKDRKERICLKAKSNVLLAFQPDPTPFKD